MGLLDFIIKVGVDASGVRKGTDDIKTQVAAMASSVGSKLAAAFSVAAIASFTKSIMDAALEQKKLAEQLDTTSEMISKIQRLASKKGLEEEGFFKIIGKLQQEMGKALTDESTFRKFQQWGIEFNDLAKEGANAVEVLVKIGQALKGLPAQDPRVLSFAQVGGKSAFKYAAATGDLAGMKAKFDADTQASIEDSAQFFEELYKGVKGHLAGIIGVPFRVASDVKKLVGSNLNPFGVINTLMGTGFSEQRKEAPTITNPFLGITDTDEEDSISKAIWAKHLSDLKKDSKGGGASVFTDALASVGGFVGGAGGSPDGTSYPSRSLRYQERTANAVEGLRRRIEQGTTF